MNTGKLHRLAVWAFALFLTKVACSQTHFPTILVGATKLPPLSTAWAGSTESLPFSATVIAADALSERQPKDIADIADYSPGVARRSNYWGVNTPTFQLRGFNGGDATAYYRDGFRYQGRGPVSMANVESIEILRGPQTAVYGWSEPGGIVQVNVKQPTTRFIREISVSADGWGRSGASADLGGMLDESSRFRLVAAKESGGSFRDRQSMRQTLLAPSYALNLQGGGEWMLALEFLDDQRTTDYGIPAVDGKPADVPSSRRYTEDWGQQHSRSNRLVTRWKLPALGGNLSLAWSWYDFRYLEYRDVEPWSVTGTTVNRWYESYPEQYRWTTAYADWSREFMIRGMSNLFSARMDCARESRALKGGVWDDYLPIDAYNPVYQAPWTPTAEYSVYDQAWSNRSLGLALQNELRQGSWSFLLGVRVGYLRQRFDYADHLPIQGETHHAQSDHAVTPRVGGRFQASDTTMFYTNFSAGKMPVLPQSRAFDGSSFSPVEGRQWEIGLKTQPVKKHWLFTAAIFNISRRNVLTRDPDHAGFSVQTGVQRSRGLELAWQGEIAPNWNFLAQSTWMDTAIEQDNRYRTGNRLPYAPQDSASAWLSHRLITAGENYWTLAGGVVHQGRRFADFPNSTRIPAYTRMDLGATYQRKSWSATLSVENFLNQRYYSSGVENRPAVIYPGAPRTLAFRLNVMLERLRPLHQ